MAVVTVCVSVCGNGAQWLENVTANVAAGGSRSGFPGAGKGVCSCSSRCPDRKDLSNEEGVAESFAILWGPPPGTEVNGTLCCRCVVGLLSSSGGVVIGWAGPPVQCVLAIMYLYALERHNAALLCRLAGHSNCLRTS